MHDGKTHRRMRFASLQLTEGFGNRAAAPICKFI